ncbi:MAG: hypothetical protein JWM31_1279, partial [Solirubrobacterales bacterium]|nr:hypothetical protein [Solirubrobacterales bacterium]
VVVRSANFPVADKAAAEGFVSCKAGERATGGGAFFPNDALNTIGNGDAIVESVPTTPGFTGGADGATPNGWYVSVNNGSGGGATTFDVYAICAAP